jgi:hypothetical protein
MTKTQIGELVAKLREFATPFDGGITGATMVEAASALELLSASKPAAQDAAKLTAEIKELVREKPTAVNAYGLKSWAKIEQKIAEALAASPAAPAQSGKAVMWVILDKDGDLVGQSMTEIKGLDWQPLYTAPQPSQPVEAGEPFDAMKHQTLLGYDASGDAIFGTDPEGLAQHKASCSAVVLDDDRATDPTDEQVRTVIKSLGVPSSNRGDAFEYVLSGWRAARAASPQATVYSLFSSSDRRNFGHLAPQEFVNAVIDAVRAQATVTQPAQTDDPIALLIEKHAEQLEDNEYAYFELAYTRRTEWMAWICSNHRDDDSNRKVIARGQGSTPQSACEAALAAAQPASGGDQC